jgi:fumarate reductase iron-sulfur subunit
MSAKVQLLVWRGSGTGRFVHYEVPAQANQTVLDAITWIQREIDPGLAYRFACRVGMCGSCAMSVNGRPRWTCRTRVAAVARRGFIQVAPLANLPVIKDLATDMTAFFDKWQRAGGRFIPVQEQTDFVMVAPDSAPRRAADQAIECIGCAICYAACDVVSWNQDYLGPAALNRAWTLVNDVRDGARAARLAAVCGDAGCHACHTQQNCRTHCPKALDPTHSIAGLKREVFKAVLTGAI